MIIRQYAAFFSSTTPWLFLCCICWWIDRLLMELGHRRQDSTFCYHSNLQYVNLHCLMTVIACTCQTIHSVLRRRRHFRREAVILGVVPPCIIHLHLLQCLICLMWTVILACIIDVSPWLCFENIVQKRASIALISMLTICVCLYLEQFLYNKTLQLQIEAIEI